MILLAVISQPHTLVDWKDIVVHGNETCANYKYLQKSKTTKGDRGLLIHEQMLLDSLSFVASVCMGRAPEEFSQFQTKYKL